MYTWLGGGGGVRLLFDFFFGRGAFLPAILLEIVTFFQPFVFIFPGHRCTHDTAENCRNDILVTGINRIGPSIREALQYSLIYPTLLRSIIQNSKNVQTFLFCGFKKIVFRFPARSDFRTLSVGSRIRSGLTILLKKKVSCVWKGKKQLNKYEGNFRGSAIIFHLTSMSNQRSFMYARKIVSFSKEFLLFWKLIWQIYLSYVFFSASEGSESGSADSCLWIIGSGFESGYFRHWLWRRQQKTNFL